MQRPRGFALFAHNDAAADRTVLGPVKLHAMLALFEYAHHLRDHIAGAFDQNLIANLQAQPPNFIFIVERGL